MGNGAESLNLINEGISALCPLCVDLADLFLLFRALPTQKLIIMFMQMIINSTLSLPRLHYFQMVTNCIS